MKKCWKNRLGFLLNHRVLFLLLMASLSIIFLCPIITSAQTSESQDWVGSYYFTDSAQLPKKRKFTDFAPSASYDITVEQNGDKLTAQFSAQGVQLAEAYDCTVKVSSGKIELYFQSLAIEGVENFRKFRKGDLLFTLIKTQIGKSTKFLFQPAAYKIMRVSPSKQKAQVYFDKP